MAATEACRGSDAQMAARFQAARTHACLSVSHIGQHALTVLQESSAFVGQGDASRGANQQFDAQVRLQAVQATPHDGGRHALGFGCSCQAPFLGH